MGDAAILRAQIPASTDPDRLEREARMAEVTERKKLEAAIAEAKVKGLTRIGGEPWSTVPEGALHVILAAAEAHLRTLPPPMFKMRLHYGEGAAAYYQYAHMSDLLKSLGGVSLPADLRKIEIEIP